MIFETNSFLSPTRKCFQGFAKTAVTARIPRRKPVWAQVRVLHWYDQPVHRQLELAVTARFFTAGQWKSATIWAGLWAWRGLVGNVQIEGGMGSRPKATASPTWIGKVRMVAVCTVVRELTHRRAAHRVLADDKFGRQWPPVHDFGISSSFLGQRPGQPARAPRTVRPVVGPFISEAILLGAVASNHRSHAMALSRSSRSDFAAASVGHHPECLLGRRSSRVYALHVRTDDSRRFCRNTTVSSGMTGRQRDCLRRK